MKIKSPAQRAAQAGAVKRWGRYKGPRKKYPETAITRVQSDGICGPMIKVVDPYMRSLIDDAMRKRMIAQSES